jgi:hypothetical protein
MTPDQAAAEDRGLRSENHASWTRYRLITLMIFLEEGRPANPSSGA